MALQEDVLSLYPQVVGLYRLCGSAAVKKELRDAFEQDSAAVCLSEDVYPDINVITGHPDASSGPSAPCLFLPHPQPHDPAELGSVLRTSVATSETNTLSAPAP